MAEPAGGVAPAIGAGEKLPADWTQDHEDLLRLLEAAAGVSAQTPAEDARAVQDALRRWADHPGAAGSREDFLAWVRYLDQHGDDFAAAAGAGGPETRDRLDQLIREGPRAGTGAGSGTPTGSGEGSLLEKFFSGTETLSAAATTALVLALVLTFWFSPSTAWIAFLESQVGRAMLLWMGRAGGVWLSAKIPHTLLHLDNLRRARTEEQRDYWTGVLEEDGRDLAIAAAFAYGGKALGRVPRAEPATEAAPPPRGKASAGKPPDVPPGPEVTPESPPEPEPAIEYPAQRVADLEDRIEALGNEAMMDYLEAIDLSTPEGAAKLAGLEREVSIAEETPAGQPRSGIEPGLSDRATPGGPQPKRYEGGRFTHEYAEPLKRAISPTPGDIPPRFAPQVASGEIIPLDQMPDGLRPEVSLGVTARVDRLGTVIYEIKPNTEASIEAGLTQVQAYARLANAMKLEGRADWTGKVVVYDAAKAKQYVP